MNIKYNLLPANTFTNFTGNRVPQIDKVVFHHTGGGNLQSNLQTLRDRKLSYHFMIDTNGDVNQLVNTNDIAWHAGNWDVNTTSIGISLVGNFLNGDPTSHQLASARDLVLTLRDIIILPNSRNNDLRLLNHKEVRATQCPGIDLAGIVNKLVQLELTKPKEVEVNNCKCNECRFFSAGVNNTSNQTPSEWAKQYWKQATDTGVIDGTNPHGLLTREQLVTILGRIGALPFVGIAK